MSLLIIVAQLAPAHSALRPEYETPLLINSPHSNFVPSFTLKIGIGCQMSELLLFLCNNTYIVLMLVLAMLLFNIFNLVC